MIKRIILMLLIASVLFVQFATAADQVFFYHTDPAGTPLAMTNASGAVVWQADYKPFGEENTVTTSPKNNKRFVGKEKDEETGLSYFGARYEDARTGRFITVDPVRAVDAHNSKTNERLLANPQRLNPYAYALNNPYRYVDQMGLNPGPINPGQGPFSQVDITSGVSVADHTIFGVFNTAANTANWFANRAWSLIELAGSDAAINLSVTTPFPHDDAITGLAAGAVKFTKNANKVREKGKRWKSGDDALQQLKEIEKAQQAAREGKLNHPIDNIEKSEQRAKNWLKSIKSSNDTN